MKAIKQFFLKYFDATENILLPCLIVISFFALRAFGAILTPLLISLMLACFFDGFVNVLSKKFHCPRLWMLTILFILVLSTLIFSMISLIPLLYAQIAQFIQQIPNNLVKLDNYLHSLPTRYPEFISESIINKITNTAGYSLDVLPPFDKVWLKFLDSISYMTEAVIYMVLVPLITFMLLKDKSQFKQKIARRIPKPEGVILVTWQQIKIKLGQYLRGILIEFLIVSILYALVFSFFKLNYALVLAILAGLAVFIPIFGTLIMTLPVVIIALIQYGFSSIFLLLIVAYIVIHLIDAYLLAPFLFSKTLHLHPLVIIIALLFFGGVWGIWGLILAVPLATFIDIVINTYIHYGDKTTRNQQGL